MNFDELEKMVGEKEKESTPYVKKEYNNNGNYKKENKINMYEVETIPSKEIDTDIFEKKGRSFAVHLFNAPDDVKKKVMIIANALVEQGFVFRHDGNKEDEVQNSILEIDNIKVESYLPYGKYNDNIQKPIISNFYELPFNYASQLYGQKYNELKKGARAIYASKVQALLGKDCTNPVDFFICYSASGDETYPKYDKNKKIDYTKLGSVGFYLRVTDKSGIATYNFKNDESISSLVKLIK